MAIVVYSHWLLVCSIPIFSTRPKNLQRHRPHVHSPQQYTIYKRGILSGLLNICASYVPSCQPKLNTLTYFIKQIPHYPNENLSWHIHKTNKHPKRIELARSQKSDLFLEIKIQNKLSWHIHKRTTNSESHLARSRAVKSHFTD